MIDPLVLEATETDGPAPWELPEVAVLPDGVLTSLYETQYDLFGPRSQIGRLRAASRLRARDAVSGAPAPAPARGAATLDPEGGEAAAETEAESASRNGRAGAEDFPEDVMEDESGRVVDRRARYGGARVGRVGDVDIDAHVPTLGAEGDRGSNLRGADFRKILSGPPARGAAAFSASILWPVAIVLALVLPFIIWPGLLPWLTRIVTQFWTPSPTRLVRLDEGESFWLGDGKYWVRARATNRGQETLEWIIVEAQIRTPDMDAAMVQQGYCGRTLSPEQAASMQAPELKAYFARPGERTRIRPGESIPCEVVVTGLRGAPNKTRVVVSDVGVLPRAEAPSGAKGADQWGEPADVREGRDSGAS